MGKPSLDSFFNLPAHRALPEPDSILSQSGPNVGLQDPEVSEVYSHYQGGLVAMAVAVHRECVTGLE